MRILNFNVRPTYIEFNDDEIILFPILGFIKREKWRELVEAYIETTDDGPHVEDVFILLKFVNSQMKIEQCISGNLIEKLQRLSGFDNAALIKAMGSAENSKFLLWKKPQPG